MQNWEIGVLFGFLTATIAAASKLTIRKSWLLENEQQGKLLRRLGFCGMSVLNPIFDVLAMSYASPSLLAGFSGLALALIVIFSNLIGEYPTLPQRLAATLIVLGQVSSMYSGDHSDDTHTLIVDIYHVYTSRLSLWVYFGVMILWLTCIRLTIVAQECNNNNNKVGASPLLQKIAWGVASGSITGLQCFVKDGLTLIKRLIEAQTLPDTKTALLLLLLILFAIGTPLTGLCVLTNCMKRYDATYSNAMHSGSFVVSVSVMSLVRYHTQPVHPIGYGFGLSVILIGVWILVQYSQADSNDAVVPGNTIIDSSNKAYNPVRSTAPEVELASFSSSDEDGELQQEGGGGAFSAPDTFSDLALRDMETAPVVPQQQELRLRTFSNTSIS